MSAEFGREHFPVVKRGIQVYDHRDGHGDEIEHQHGADQPPRHDLELLPKVQALLAFPPETNQPLPLIPGITHALWILSHIRSSLKFCRSLFTWRAWQFALHAAPPASLARPRSLPSINKTVATTIAGSAHQTPNPIFQPTPHVGRGRCSGHPRCAAHGPYQPPARLARLQLLCSQANPKLRARGELARQRNAERSQ